VRLAGDDGARATSLQFRYSSGDSRILPRAVKALFLQTNEEHIFVATGLLTVRWSW